MNRRSERNRRKPSKWSPSGQVDFQQHMSKMASELLDDKTPATPVIKKTLSLSSEESFTEADFQSLLAEVPDNVDSEILVKNNGGILKKLLHTVSMLLLENKYLKERLESLEKSSSQRRLDNYYDRLVQLEIEQGQLNQYGRKNNIELTGIPENVKQDELESKVIEILSEIDVPVA